MLAPRTEIWNGKIGEVKGTEHRINLSEGSKRYRSQPYKAVPQDLHVEQ